MRRREIAASTASTPGASVDAPHSFNRREVLVGSVKAGLGSMVAWSALQAGAFAAEAERPLRVALIGCGWYGKTDLFHLIQVAPVEVVGLCDVDSQMAGQAAELVSKRQSSHKKPPTYSDYRQLLKDQSPEIALIGTPDHWHCLPMIDAVKAGADVYVQKPISYDVIEGQAMVAAARKYKRTVQVGLQRRSTPHLLEAKERYIDSGLLGKIAYVDIHSYYGGPGEYPANQAAPQTIDWEMYVGPASWREYNPGIHPRNWRACREFSNGQTGDLCVHLFDVVRTYLNLSWPRHISAQGGILMRSANTNVNTHDTQTALFDYGDVKLVWSQRNWGENPDPQYPWGATIYGDKGTLKISVWSYDYIPHGSGNPVHRDFFDEVEKYPEDKEHRETEVFAAPATRRHMLNFLAARREAKLPVADIEQGYISSACCILANVSMDLGRGLQWDGTNGKVIGDEEANRRLAREYRGPWIHPTPETI